MEPGKKGVPPYYLCHICFCHDCNDPVMSNFLYMLFILFKPFSKGGVTWLL